MAAIKLNSQKIEAVECKLSEKTLGVYMTPSMSQSKQFQ